MELALAETLAHRGVRDPKLLAALMRVERARFLPPDVRARAGEDEALPIGHGQVAPPPSVVAAMTAALELPPGAKVLEVGTGTGYHAALLCELGANVLSMEHLPPLAETAALALASCGLRVRLRCGDGRAGWADEAPFQGIVVGASAPEVPRALLRQLAVGGRLVMPVGPPSEQDLVVVIRLAGGTIQRPLRQVSFAPLA